MQDRSGVARGRSGGRWWRAIGRQPAGSGRIGNEGVWSRLSSRRILSGGFANPNGRLFMVNVAWNRMARPGGSSCARSRF